MYVSAQVRTDYAARSHYAKNNRRPDEDERALIHKVDERPEDERRDEAARQDLEPGFEVEDDEETIEYSRPVPSAGTTRRKMIAETASPASSTGTLWSLIGALDEKAGTSAPPVAKRQSSAPAGALYDLLDQVIAHP